MHIKSILAPRFLCFLLICDMLYLISMIAYDGFVILGHIWRHCDWCHGGGNWALEGGEPWGFLTGGEAHVPSKMFQCQKNREKNKITLDSLEID